ncbi:acyltransferase [Micromonospora sp. NPDC006766]|uniref:acyltransferase family protein n=1 Tax=Micromonospora sp. NPDC006766 TaxID=3154778 RepID=UPI00340CE16A
MRRLQRLAERTPAGRERYIDLLRALAIMTVVLGHWAIAVIGHDPAGRPTGHSALADMPWAYPITWVVQVIPVFFLVGGFANAASLTSQLRHGGTVTGWLLDRSARLVPPTTVLLVVLAGTALAGWLHGTDPVDIRIVVWFATIPLWFLGAYLVVVPLAPAMYALHRRFGLTVAVALVPLVALGDVAQLTGRDILAQGNYVLGWLAIHQLGFAWYDTRLRPDDAPQRRGLWTRRLPMTRRAALAFLGGGLAALALLTLLGPYPVAMLAVPGERLNNSSPPTVALLAAATAQLGLILLLRGRAERWLRRRRPWQAVVAVNSVVLTMFLWHLTAAVLLIALLDTLHRLPTPPVASLAWFAWRVPWLLTLSVVLTGLVAIFGPVEARSGHRRPRRRPRARGWGLARALPMTFAVTGFGLLVLGVTINVRTPESAPEPLGVPVPALIAYLAGAGTLRFLRSGSGSRG